MDDFLKSMKDNLERREEPLFREEAWTAMQEKLQEEPKKSTKKSFLWWIPFLGLMLLSSAILNFWFYQQLENNKDFISEQKRKIEKDTIYQTKYLYKQDTIFQTNIKKEIQTRYIYKAHPNVITSLDLQMLQDRFVSSSTTFNRVPAKTRNTFKDQNRFNLSNLEIGFTSDLIAGKIKKRKRKKLENQLAFERIQFESLNLPFLNASLLKDVFILENNNEIERMEEGKKTFAQRLNPIRPKQFILGVSGGSVKPTENGISETSGLTFGTTMEISFSDHFRLFGGVDYFSINYNSAKLEEAFGIPDVNPPGDDFFFEEAELNQRTIQYSIGLKYLLLLDNKINPYLGLGFSSLYLLPHDIEYEFENEMNNEELSIIESIAEQRIQSNQLLFKFGIEYPFASHWSGDLHTYYRMRINNNKGLSSPNIRGLRLGLKYKF